MKFLVPLLCLAISIQGKSMNSNEHQPSHFEEKLWTSVGEFGHSLLQQLIDNAIDQNNVLISPLALLSALSMIVPGARGETKKEMLKALHLMDIPPKGLKSAFSDLTSREYDNVTRTRYRDLQFIMRLANRIYAQKDYPLAPSYVDDVKMIFHTDAVNVDFAGNDVKVMKTINAFIKQKTNDLIPKILHQPLNKDTVMVLVNALYFKGDWQKKMSEKDLPLTFNKGCGKLEQKHSNWLTVEQQMLYLESTSLNAQLLQIPYRSREFSASMLIILPSVGQNCKTQKWLKSLRWRAILEEIRLMETTNVLLTLPRFEVGYRRELQDTFPNIGMSKVFSQQEADLLGMVSNSAKKLYISKIIHETKMIVTETGTEAAAASMPILTPRSFRPDTATTPVKVTVNRSFYVAILFGKYDVKEVLPLLTGLVEKV